MIMSPNREQIKSKPNDEDLIARINALEPSERKQKHNKITRLMPTIKDALERDVWLSDIAKLLRQQGLEVSLTTLRSKLSTIGLRGVRFNIFRRRQFPLALSQISRSRRITTTT